MLIIGFWTRSRLGWILGLKLALAFVALVIPTEQTSHWVGIHDVEVTFVVEDTSTRKPIPGAAIHIQEMPDGFEENRPEFRPEPLGPEFVLVTDSQGRARKVIERCMTSGAKGPRIDVYNVHLPGWNCRATCDGYKPSDWKAATTLELESKARAARGKPYATITLPIRLERLD